MVDPVTTGIAIWLARDVVAPDAYERIVDKLTTPDHVKELQRRIRRNTGIRAGRAFRRWYRQQHTWELLVSFTEEGFEELVQTLEAELLRSRLLRLSVDVARDRAARLVEATIADFIPSLPPSTAVAVARVQIGEQLRNVQQQLDADATFRQALERLPPSVRDVLLAAETVDGPSARRMAAAAGAGSQKESVERLVRPMPAWILDGKGELVVAGAELCSAYGLGAEAAILYERAAEFGIERGHNYARAAAYAFDDGDVERAETLLSKSEAAGGHSLALIIRSLLATGATPAAVLGVTSAIDATSDPQVALLHARAVAATDDEAAAVAFLEQARTRHPAHVGIGVELAKYLFARARTGTSPDRQRDESRALSLALTARDARRSWGGDSAEATALAGVICLALDDPARALALTVPPPEGSASDDEARVGDVAFVAVHASIALGEVEQASDLVERMAVGFLRALATAELVDATTDDSSRICAAFNSALEFAEDDDQRRQVSLAALLAGCDDVVAASGITAHDEDLVDFDLARRDAARGRIDEAIQRLRRHPESEPCCHTLALLQRRSGSVTACVDTLVETARRFQHPRHLVEAAVNRPGFCRGCFY